MPSNLSRALLGAAPRPVAAVHLGLGGFFRAHQAAYTDLAPDAEQWGYAAFTGRSPDLARRLAAQAGLYTLLRRGADGVSGDIVRCLSETVPGGDTARWLDLVGRPTTRLLTLTVTEAAYHRTTTGGLDLDHTDVAADLSALRTGRLEDAATVPGRLVAGLQARRIVDGGVPLTIAPCDNLLHNGRTVHRVVLDLAEAVDPDLAAWIEARVAFVDSEVDRITPRTTPADLADARRLTGYDDVAPVATEPFSEWVLAGDFPAGRPRWEEAASAGALFVDDVTPYEERKLWLLNGAHSLLAYAGSARGHETVADAIGDETCRGWVEAWWDQAARHLALDVTGYRAALLERFANPSIRHLLAQIAADGSQKLPIRILPVLTAERAAGRLPEAATRVLGAWVAHLRGHGAPVTDPHAEELTAAAAGPDGVRRVLAALDRSLPDDAEVVASVAGHAEELSR